MRTELKEALHGFKNIPPEPLKKIGFEAIVRSCIFKDKYF
jgi:hypothetical protein